MPAPLAHVYDLALRALAEQERQVAELHSRLTAVLAAGGVGVSLLARPAFGGAHPHGTIATAAALLGLAGIALAVVAAARLLLAERLAFTVNAGSVVALAPGALERTDAYFRTMTASLDELWRMNAARMRQRESVFTVVVCGMLAGVCGLAIAAAVG